MPFMLPTSPTTADTSPATDRDPASAEHALRELVRTRSGHRLPPERSLATQLGVSRPRLRALLGRLTREGLVEARQGSGTYAVTAQHPAAPASSFPPLRPRRAAILIDASLKLANDPFFSLLLERLQEAFQAAGTRCIVERFGAETPLPPLEDGAVTIGLAGASALLARRRPAPKTGPLVPLVALLLPDGARPTRGASVFQLDDSGAGEEAARRLIARGDCSRLLFFGRDTLPAARERRAGAERACRDAGLPLETIPCSLNYAGGLSAGRALTDADLAGTGLLAANDWLAVGLRAGLPTTFPPRPLVSFDGLPLAADPALAIESLAVPLDDLARDAVMEIERLRGSVLPTGRLVRYSLV